MRSCWSRTTRTISSSRCTPSRNTTSRTASRSLDGQEAPDRGVVEPGQFIPIAETRDVIVPIGRWVLEEACRQAATWSAIGRPLRMSVNVSARQLDRDDLIDDVHAALDHGGLEATTLTLEVTETAAMRDADATVGRLDLLKALGVRIAIDDFGSGYSSRAYLSRFPLDALKIDRSLISGIASSAASTSLIPTLVQLGRALQVETVAEGIEEPAQLRALQREHCDQGQGFLLARSPARRRGDRRVPEHRRRRGRASPVITTPQPRRRGLLPSATPARPCHR